MERRTFNNPVVTDAQGKQITSPAAMYNVIHQHFNNHFFDPNQQEIAPFIGKASPLEVPITTEEVQQAARKLNNNCAPGIDNISAELIKYGPRELHEEIRSVLNDSLQNHQDLDLGSGIMVTLQKPGKTCGPVKNLCPVILLLIICKILSNIILQRIHPQFEEYLSPSQSTYRSKRSTSDLVWAHRFIIAKAQSKKMPIFITGLDLSAAFDTIKRDELLAIMDTIVSHDEVRMIRLLLCNTSLEIRMKGVESKSFCSNVGSPQGDAISGVLFNIYLEDALRRIRTKLNNMNTHIEHRYAMPGESHHHCHPKCASEIRLSYTG